MGVATDYYDWSGSRNEVPESTVAAVLAAMDIDASSEEAAQSAIERHHQQRWSQMLPPVVVLREGWTPWFWVHIPHSDSVEVWVELEDGTTRDDVPQQEWWVEPVEVDGDLIGEATFELPADLPMGWHTLHARSGSRHVTTTLIVTPQHLGLPEHLHHASAWGFMTQLYSVRSRRSWGIGDLADLADLATWSAHELGAGFVLVNPLHAASPLPPMEPSPYLPVTRRFANPLYLRVESIPEYAFLDPAARVAVDHLGAQARTLTSADRLDRDRSWAFKLAALELVRKVPRSPGRQAAYDAYRDAEGEGLRDFATWCALAEEWGDPSDPWPDPLSTPRSDGVPAARERLADRIELFSWLQWVLDEQLAHVHQSARDAGMPVGLVQDLAVGVHPKGADAWALRGFLAQGVTVGAPPDAFNQLGQDWSQPPWRPDRLAEAGYAPYRDMVHTVLRHAGGLRVDHVIGLFRLWWVPEGRPPSEGTYVRYDHEALIGILALEAHRSGAVVIGEDLGVVQPFAREYLRERGILGTSILWFERGWDGNPLPPEQWRELCLATVTTHDLPPTAGYLDGEHVRLREELGLLERTYDEELAIDAAEREQWLVELRRQGVLAEGASSRETVEALHRLLALTPCRLLGVSLPDAVGDRRAMNQPGTNEEYPNWQLPLADDKGQTVLLEDLADGALLERARRLARATTGWRG